MCGEEHAVLSRHGSAMGCRHISKSSVAAVWDEPSRAAASSCVLSRGCLGSKLPSCPLPV